MKKIAIIPARGGSKRIPRKNIKDFLGKPIIAYSIEAAKASGLFDEIMVSTDDEEIAEVARTYGAEVPFMRSNKNADDFATTADVVLEVLGSYKNLDQQFDYTCCIYPTAPLLKEGHLKEAFDLMLRESFDTVFPITIFSYPILRSLRLKNGSKVEMNWPEYQQSRSQDLAPAYHDAGQFYWINVASFKEEKELYSSNSGAVVLNEIEVQDIDNLTDWKLAELKYKIISDEI